MRHLFKSLSREGDPAERAAKANALVDRSRNLGAVCMVKDADPKRAVARARELMATEGWGSLETPAALLCLAAELGLTEMAELFVEKGAPINGVSDGRTPLAFAAGSKELKTAKRLMELGASPNGAGAGDEPPLVAAVFCDQDGASAPVIRALLAAGADPNACGSCGRTALCAAACELNAAACEALAKGGADWSLADEDGRTPFMLALMNCNRDDPAADGPRVARLAGLGAIPSGGGQEGPLLWALLASEEKGREWIALLVDLGADPNERAPDGESALSTCMRFGGYFLGGAQEANQRVDLLLRLGADPTRPGADGNKPADLPAIYPYGRVPMEAWLIAKATGEAQAPSRKGPRV